MNILQPQAFIFHHTGGRGDVSGVQQTLRQRGLGVEYVMDRDGNITRTGDPGASQMLPGWGVGRGLNNGNTVGMEVIAKNNGDVTPAQVAAAQKFIQQNYPDTPVYGHGEVNPGHKEADEGLAIVDAIRAQRGLPTQPMAFAPTAQPQQQAPQAGGLMGFAKAQAPNLPLFASTGPRVPGGSAMPQSVWDAAMQMSGSPQSSPGSFFGMLGIPAASATDLPLSWFNRQNTETG